MGDTALEHNEPRFARLESESRKFEQQLFLQHPVALTCALVLLM